jgi:predicted RNA-binding protein with PIN domain
VDKLIVDGYNVVFAWPELAALKDVNLDDARQALIAIMADYAALTRQQVTIVFDSHRRPDSEGSTQRVSGVQVVFSGRKSSADHVIERLIFEAKASDQVTVATSDSMQRDLALGKEVKTISALLLKAEVETALARRDAEMGDRKARSELSRRLEDRLDEQTRRRLDQLRGKSPLPDKP